MLWHRARSSGIELLHLDLSIPSRRTSPHREQWPNSISVQPHHCCRFANATDAHAFLVTPHLRILIGKHLTPSPHLTSFTAAPASSDGSDKLRLDYNLCAPMAEHLPTVGDPRHLASSNGGRNRRPIQLHLQQRLRLTSPPKAPATDLVSGFLESPAITSSQSSAPSNPSTEAWRRTRRRWRSKTRFHPSSRSPSASRSTSSSNSSRRRAGISMKRYSYSSSAAGGGVLAPPPPSSPSIHSPVVRGMDSVATNESTAAEVGNNCVRAPLPGKREIKYVLGTVFGAGFGALIGSGVLSCTGSELQTPCTILFPGMRL